MRLKNTTNRVLTAQGVNSQGLMFGPHDTREVTQEDLLAPDVKIKLKSGLLKLLPGAKKGSSPRIATSTLPRSRPRPTKRKGR